MKILLIGGSSFIGKNFIESAPREWEISASYCNSEDFPEFVSKFKNVKPFHLDLTKENPELRLSFFDIVIYLATITPAQQKLSQNGSEDVYYLNSYGVNKIIDSIRGCKKFIYLSSGIYYLRKNNSDYRKSKLLGESNVISGTKERGFEYIILRNMEVYGKYMAKHKIYRRLAESCLKGDSEFFIEGDGGNYLDTMHIQDYIEGFFKIINLDIKDKIIDYCKSEPITLKELAQEISKAFNKPNFKLIAKGDPTEDTRFKLDNSEMKLILNFEPKISLAEGLKIWKEENLI